MIYCIANQLSYSSSLNIFAVVAGVFLIRGHLGAVRLVTWFSAFLLSGMLLGSLVVFPWVQPVDYSLLMLRQHPLGIVASLLLAAVFSWMLFWIYQQLRLPAVVEACAAAGQRRGAPMSAFAAGGVLVVFLGVMLQLTLNGKSAQEAKRLAVEQHGRDYKYFVSSIYWGGGRVSAQLTAYKEGDTKEVAVEWNE